MVDLPELDGSNKIQIRRHRKLNQAQATVTEPVNKQAAPTEVNVGQRLRQLRAEQDLSIRALAKKSGLNVNTLSLIENNKTSPSVSTLQQLAFALNVPITAFFETDIPKNTIAFQKAGQRPVVAFERGTMEDLGAGLTSRGAEPFIVTLEPNADSGPNPIVHTGREFVYCMEGRLAYTIEDHTYVLEPGDSLLFEAYLPHRWQNVGVTQSRSLLALCPDDERDRPTERHFKPE
jgi:transcriptional regulator with XRE-family HTH domain